MNETILGNQLRKVPSIAVGCMRLSEKSKEEMNHFIHSALEQGAYFFDHADIYGGGMSETVFGDAFSHDPSLKREDVFLQSKCGIRQGCYDLSKEYISTRSLLFFVQNVTNDAYAILFAVKNTAFNSVYATKNHAY